MTIWHMTIWQSIKKMAEVGANHDWLQDYHKYWVKYVHKWYKIRYKESD